MLGRLARWLRIFGLDVAYDPGADDAELVCRAAEEARMILTRDTHLVQRRLARHSLLIRSSTLSDQLHQVCRELNLRVDRERILSRCVVCNRLLVPVSIDSARHRVPPFVARTQTRFKECRECRRLFWQATHVVRILDRLREMGFSPQRF